MIKHTQRDAHHNDDKIKTTDPDGQLYIYRTCTIRLTRLRGSLPPRTKADGTANSTARILWRRELDRGRQRSRMDNSSHFDNTRGSANRHATYGMDR